MRRCRFPLPLLATGSVLAAVVGFALLAPAKEKAPVVSPDDVTLRLFQVLDTAYAGTLTDFYVLGDVYKDPKAPDKELQHILKAEYDKSKGFGRFRLYVRNVDKLSPDQLKNYTPKQIYEFGNVDVEKFSTTDPGPFGKSNDLYLRATPAGTLARAPITDEVRKAYENYVSQWLLPALEKK